MDWGYVAGYFDGEGCVSIRPRNRSLAWYNSDLASLEAIRAFIGCGAIRTRQHRNATYRQMHVLMVARKSELEPLIEQLLRHAIVKREALILLRECLGTVKDVPQWGLLAAVGIDEVRRLYLEEGWTQQMIAEHCGVSQTAVKKMLKRHGVQARSRSEAAKQASLTSPGYQERNRKISEARRREWADPEIRASRIAAIRAAQPKRIATRQQNANRRPYTKG